MNRKEGRAKAKEALDATNSFQAVYAFEPKTIEETPVASIHSRRMAESEFTYDELKLRGQLWVTIWVRIDDDQAAVEDQLDDLVREAYLALRKDFTRNDINSVLAESEAGYRIVDKVPFRVERFSIAVEETLEDPAN